MRPCRVAGARRLCHPPVRRPTSGASMRLPFPGATSNWVDTTGRGCLLRPGQGEHRQRPHKSSRTRRGPRSPVVNTWNSSAASQQFHARAEVEREPARRSLHRQVRQRRRRYSQNGYTLPTTPTTNVKKLLVVPSFGTLQAIQAAAILTSSTLRQAASRLPAGQTPGIELTIREFDKVPRTT
jgi:hypothetical protein